MKRQFRRKYWFCKEESACREILAQMSRYGDIRHLRLDAESKVSSYLELNELLNAVLDLCRAIRQKMGIYLPGYNDDRLRLDITAPIRLQQGFPVDALLGLGSSTARFELTDCKFVAWKRHHWDGRDRWQTFSPPEDADPHSRSLLGVVLLLSKPTESEPTYGAMLSGRWLSVWGGDEVYSFHANVVPLRDHGSLPPLVQEQIWRLAFSGSNFDEAKESLLSLADLDHRIATDTVVEYMIRCALINRRKTLELYKQSCRAFAEQGWHQSNSLLRPLLTRLLSVIPTSDLCPCDLRPGESGWAKPSEIPWNRCLGAVLDGLRQGSASHAAGLAKFLSYVKLNFAGPECVTIEVHYTVPEYADANPDREEERGTVSGTYETVVRSWAHPMLEQAIKNLST